ncbi:MAG: helix-turn-helix transcriptional regulator [Clostridiales bacterium]|nr:helix-turn-helix transcriptional regulator [Clostridiales bacterium]
MNDIKATVARNIASLRLAHGMTQSELAEKLNYSDKAISKWERAESMPDISVLVKIAEIFGISLDALVLGAASEKPEETPAEPETASEEIAAEEPVPAPVPSPYAKHNHRLFTQMSIMLVWIAALVTFVLISILAPEVRLPKYLSFAYAVPASMIVWLVFNSIWFTRHRNYLIISLLMWSLLLALCLTLVPLSASVWQLLLLGLPGQAIIFFWSKLKKRS